MRKRKSRAQIFTAVGLIAIALILLIGGRWLSEKMSEKPSTVIDNIEISGEDGQEVQVITE